MQRTDKQVVSDYRSIQATAAELARILRKQGIRSVHSKRGREARERAAKGRG